MLKSELRDMINRYNIVQVDDKLRIYNLEGTEAEKIATFAKIKAVKAEIIAYLQSKGEIEGLEYLAQLADQWKEYYAKTEKAYETECLEAYLPKKPSETMEEANSRYPRAAAYRQAEKYANAANYHKSAAGIRAKERIEDSEDYMQVIKDMEDDWSSAATESMWD